LTRSRRQPVSFSEGTPYNVRLTSVTRSRMQNHHKGKVGVRRIWNALRYSLAGLKAAYQNEDAFRQEILLAAVLIPIAMVCPVNLTGKALMVSSVLLVLIVELLNSAVEAAVDRISLEDHTLAKRAKDLGSAAVFLSLINVGVVWLLTLLPMP
jgi:diacylglycerol kinase (ATP)